MIAVKEIKFACLGKEDPRNAGRSLCGPTKGNVFVPGVSKQMPDSTLGHIRTDKGDFITTDGEIFAEVVDQSSKPGKSVSEIAPRERAETNMKPPSTQGNGQLPIGLCHWTRILPFPIPNNDAAYAGRVQFQESGFSAPGPADVSGKCSF